MTPKEIESMLDTLHVGQYSIKSHTVKKIGISVHMINAAIAHGKMKNLARGVIDRSELARWISQTPFAAAKLCESIEKSSIPSIPSIPSK